VARRVRGLTRVVEHDEQPRTYSPREQRELVADLFALLDEQMRAAPD